MPLFFGCQGDFRQTVCGKKVVRRPGRRRCARKNASVVEVGSFLRRFCGQSVSVIARREEQRGTSRRRRHSSACLHAASTESAMCSGCVRLFVFERDAHGNGRSRQGVFWRSWTEVGFFLRDRRCCGGPQVYNQKLVYRMMVVVNGATLLWITGIFSTTSNVYGPHKAVGRSCMFLVAKLDKKRGCAKNRVSSQSIPVDIHTLIHR